MHVILISIFREVTAIKLIQAQVAFIIYQPQPDKHIQISFFSFFFLSLVSEDW